MPATLYTKERQIIEFITQFIQRYGYAPTLKEIGAALGMNSPATVHEHIDRLRQKGFIKKLDGTARGLEIVTEKYKSGSSSTAVELPVLGYIAAGSPLERRLRSCSASAHRCLQTSACPDDRRHRRELPC